MKRFRTSFINNTFELVILENVQELFFGGAHFKFIFQSLFKFFKANYIVDIIFRIFQMFHNSSYKGLLL